MEAAYGELSVESGGKLGDGGFEGAEGGVYLLLYMEAVSGLGK